MGAAAALAAQQTQPPGLSIEIELDGFRFALPILRCSINIEQDG